MNLMSLSVTLLIASTKYKQKQLWKDRAPLLLWCCENTMPKATYKRKDLTGLMVQTIRVVDGGSGQSTAGRTAQTVPLGPRVGDREK